MRHWRILFVTIATPYTMGYHVHFLNLVFSHYGMQKVIQAFEFKESDKPEG